jgi:hemerythrin-like domain-containing protein
MEATRRLQEEHRAIEKAIPMLERLLGRHTGISIGSDQVLEFFRGFADAGHHHKEEVVLFPALEARGVPRREGLVFELLKEHGAGRRLMREIVGLLGPASEDYENCRALLANRIDDYVDHLRAHIEREETQLWPLVQRTLSPEDDRAIAAGYDRVDGEEVGQRNYRRYLEWARMWAA